MEPFNILVILEIVTLWKGQHEARFRPFETKIASLKSISRDLSNGTLQNFSKFGESRNLEWSKWGEIWSVWDENWIIKKLFARSIEWKPLNLMHFFYEKACLWGWEIAFLTNFRSKVNVISSVWDENHIIEKLFARSIEWKPLNLMYFYMKKHVDGAEKSYFWWFFVRKFMKFCPLGMKKYQNLALGVIYRCVASESQNFEQIIL